MDPSVNLAVDYKVKTRLPSVIMAQEMTVGRLALATGVKASTVRYYERLGLLPRAMRTANGYRVFAPKAIRRLIVVRAAQQFGFSLNEIAAFLRVRDTGGQPCESVRNVGKRMLTRLDSDIADLRARRRRIHRTLRHWDRLLSTNLGDRPVYLLESLAPRRNG